MGVITAIVIGIIGLVYAYLINFLPLNYMLYINPICWSPNNNCQSEFDYYKVYIVVLGLAITTGFIPFI